MKFKNSSSILALLSIFVTSHSFAASAGSEDEHLLSLSGGIASPAVTTPLRENPAGLIYNSRLKIEGSAESGNNDFDPMTLGAHLFLGNGSAAAGVGFSKSTASNSNGTVDFGLGAQVSDVAIGAAAEFGMGDGEGVGGVNVGAIFNSTGKTQVGLAVFDVTASGPRSVGAGVATDLNGSAVFGLDASTNTEFEGLTVTPGLGVNIQQIQMNMGYGIRIDDDHGSYLSEGFSAGLGISIGSSMHLSAYYQHLSKFFVGLAFML